ncbi:MAG TPA: FHA domain-containing protein [Gemmataceae bacterium]|nr:FHA domain-containing protein [Gemmataceae bacterium]
MQPTAITLTVLKGPLAGQEYVFHEPAEYVLGRADECYPRLPDDYYHKDVSRRHCLFGVNPPEMWVQDLGSKNGTYVNGQNIGQRPSGDGESGQLTSLPRELLKDGDEIALGGNVVFRVGVFIVEEVAV